jgi:hypothetical protein
LTQARHLAPWRRLSKRQAAQKNHLPTVAEVSRLPAFKKPSPPWRRLSKRQAFHSKFKIQNFSPPPSPSFSSSLS